MATSTGVVGGEAGMAVGRAGRKARHCPKLRPPPPCGGRSRGSVGVGHHHAALGSRLASRQRAVGRIAQQAVDADHAGHGPVGVDAVVPAQVQVGLVEATLGRVQGIAGVGGLLLGHAEIGAQVFAIADMQGTGQGHGVLLGLQQRHTDAEVQGAAVLAMAQRQFQRGAQFHQVGHAATDAEHAERRGGNLAHTCQLAAAAAKAQHLAGLVAALAARRQRKAEAEILVATTPAQAAAGAGKEAALVLEVQQRADAELGFLGAGKARTETDAAAHGERIRRLGGFCDGLQRQGRQDETRNQQTVLHGWERSTGCEGIPVIAMFASAPKAFLGKR
mmetsp:Transcript_62116/g.171789  ORF Transcript_62116/g.171789 Transcript_62116/m.171789 type:complete len:333 (-) Transcript_62116:830-1828(-)